MSKSLHTDVDLVAACQRGERVAQYTLYQRYSKAMLNTAYRITGSEEDAKDVLQVAFLKIFKKISDFRGQSTIGAWIKRIVVNTAINHGRKKGLNVVAGMDMVMEHPAPPAEITAEDRKALQADAEVARRALQQLPNGYRTVLTLYLLEGYDHQEISEILDVSLSTSLTQYHRGIKRLRKELDNLNNNGSDQRFLHGK